MKEPNLVLGPFESQAANCLRGWFGFRCESWQIFREAVPGHEYLGRMYGCIYLGAFEILKKVILIIIIITIITHLSKINLVVFFFFFLKLSIQLTGRIKQPTMKMQKQKLHQWQRVQQKLNSNAILAVLNHKFPAAR